MNHITCWNLDDDGGGKGNGNVMVMAMVILMSNIYVPFKMIVQVVW